MFLWHWTVLSYVTKVWENSVVDSNSIIEDSFANLLNYAGFFVGEVFRCIQTVRILNFMSVLDWGADMGGVILAAHQNVLKYVQILAHIIWHLQCDDSIHIVLIQIDTDIDCCFHIDCNKIFSLSPF